MICEFSLEDVEVILSLHKVSFSGVIPLNKRRLINYSEFGKVLVARESKELIGYIIAYPTFSDSVKILCVAVKESWKREGIGKTLVKKIFEWSKSLGRKKIWLYVRVKNKAGVKFWNSLGFKKERKLKNYFGGEDILLMKRTI
jgi:ribosomal-protein-alanine N-acetyltransferase